MAILVFAAIDTLVRIRAAERERDAYVTELEAETQREFGEPLTSGAAVRAKLADVEGGGMSGQIPERGALELLEMLTRVATPKGGRPPPPAAGGQLPPGYTMGMGADGNPTVLGPDGQPASLDAAGNPVAAGGEPAPVALSPVPDSNAGIVADDQLQMASVEIRELKVEMRLAATRATAQDRLAVKLEEIECIGPITKGMIKQRNDRESFDMSISHNCFYGSMAQSGDASADEAEEQGDGEG